MSKRKIYEIMQCNAEELKEELWVKGLVAGAHQSQIYYYSLNKGEPCLKLFCYNMTSADISYHLYLTI